MLKRHASILIENLRIRYHLIQIMLTGVQNPLSTWQFLKVCDPTHLHNLKVMLGIACAQRLLTYGFYNAQNEFLAMHPVLSSTQTELVYPISQVRMLQTLIPFIKPQEHGPWKNKSVSLKLNGLYTSDPLLLATLLLRYNLVDFGLHVAERNIGYIESVLQIAKETNGEGVEDLLLYCLLHLTHYSYLRNSSVFEKYGKRLRNVLEKDEIKKSIILEFSHFADVFQVKPKFGHMAQDFHRLCNTFGHSFQFLKVRTTLRQFRCSFFHMRNIVPVAVKLFVWNGIIYIYRKCNPETPILNTLIKGYVMLVYTD